MGIFQDNVGRVVRRYLAEGEIALRHEGLLNPSMAESMEGKQLRVESHLRQPKPKPRIEFVVQDWSEGAVVSARLEQGSIWANVLLANNALEGVDGTDWAQRGTLVVPGQWDLLDPLTVLDCLCLEQLEEDTLGALELNVLYVPPTQEADRIYVLVRLRD